MSQNTPPQPGDVVNGHVLTSSGQWVPLAPVGDQTRPGPYPGGPAPGAPTVGYGEGAVDGSPLGAAPAYGAPQAPRRRGVGKRVLVGVGGAVVLVVGIAVATSGDEDSPGDATSAGTTARGGADAEEAAQPAAEPAAQVDLTEFSEIDAAAWERIAKDPDAAEGEKVIVFAEVTQFDSATGTDVFRANVGSVQPAAEFELETNTIVGGSTEMLDDVVQGDVVKVHAEVSGAFEYETQVGGATVVPALEAAAVESVGYLDITADATLGDPVWREYGGVEVPVTVLNSGDATRTFMVDVVAESPDGSVQLGTATAYIENLAPGQTANASADFFEDLPTDAVLKVVSVERHAY